jgi:putative peptide zinc metalloprotease protein
MIGMPIIRAVRHLQTRQTLRERRVRILGIAAAAIAALGLLAALVPLPQRTQAEGVIWLPERSLLRAGANGFIGHVQVQPGAVVKAGQALISRVDPALDAQIRTLEARIAELEATYSVEFVNDRTRAEMVRDQQVAEQAALDRARERAASLLVAAEVDGVFSLAAPQDLPGRWHRQGEVLGYVLGADEPIVRVVVEQAEADLVGRSTHRVAVRLADEIGRVIPGHISRQVPAGRDETPSKALVATGGGRLTADPRDPEGRKTLERVFQIDVALNERLGRTAAFGQRVYVRFELEPAPLALQVWRALRRLFLRHFDV